MGRNGEIDGAPPSSVLQVAWNRYLHQLDKKPLRTKVNFIGVVVNSRVSPPSVLAYPTWHRLAYAAPASTQALTAAGMAGASDLVAQRISSTAPINWRRTALMAVRLNTMPHRYA